MTTELAVSRQQLDPATYRRHALHIDERAWPETNCYVDLWIELLHTLELDPVPTLAVTLAMDFEGDQWTFFKPALADLYTLYGIDVQELTVWRALLDHTVEQIERGHVVLIEADAFFLPDTAGVSYQIAHTKTTIAAFTIDPATRTLGYFHNAGYFIVDGENFDGLFRTGGQVELASALAPYVEIAKLGQLHREAPEQLAASGYQIARKHFERRPRSNPVTRYRTRFLRDVAWLASEELTTFHLYAFATLRQCGACAELGAVFLRWMAAQRTDLATPIAADAFDTIASNAKALQFKVARAVSTRKPTDFEPMLAAMEQAWDTAMAHLTPRYGA